MHLKGYNINRLKASIDDLVVKTILSLIPEMKVEKSKNKERYNI